MATFYTTLFGLLFLPSFSPLTSSLPCRTLSRPLLPSVIPTLFSPLQSYTLVSHSYTLPPLGFVPLYSFLFFLLHSIFVPPSDRKSLTVQTSSSRIWTFPAACLSLLGVWLEEAEPDYSELLTFTTTLDWVIAKVRTPNAAVPPSVPALVQVMVPVSDLDLYRTFSVREKLNKMAYA